EIEAIITPTILRAQYAQDAVAQVESGLATGISPGFRLPPERVVPRAEAEHVEVQAPDPARRQFGAVLRRVRSALLYEFSIVTRPAYHGGQIGARCWAPDGPASAQAFHPLMRWRL